MKINLREILFHGKGQSKKESIVPGREGGVSSSLRIQLPTLEEDARIWREVGTKYFRIPGVIRRHPVGLEE